MIVSYEARRRLVSYHSQGSEYTLDLLTQNVTPPSPQDLKRTAEAMAGNVEVQYFGEKRTWGITIIPLQRSSALFALVDEFLSSTADGQIFTFDPYGNGGAMAVIRADEGYSLTPFQEIDGPNDYFSVSFQVREL